MDAQVIIDMQKKRFMMHKVIYMVFCFHRIAIQFVGQKDELRDTIVLLTMVLLCFGTDLFFNRCDFFENIKVLQYVRYAQCMITAIMFVFFGVESNSELMMLCLVMMFFLEFFLSLGIQDREKIWLFLLYMDLPVVLMVLVRTIMHLNNAGIFLLFEVIVFLFVLSSAVLANANYILDLYHRILKQEYDMGGLELKNKKVIDMQERMKDTNMLLNEQKNHLQYANRQIREANEEMVAQAEILHFISMSFEVPKISNQITDAIMRVKKLGFCAVYIRQNVYLNKHANYAVRTDIAHLQGKIKDNMEPIYQDMMDHDVKEKVYYEDIRNQFPFLKDVDIRSVYVKVLECDGEIYGLFMLGDEREHLFDQKMSFYDAILAQYDIAISNARIYNEMQQMARKDGLTGINNRVYFNQLFKETVEQMKKTGGCMSVALFDIDKFKSVNDTYGHLAGDEVIKRIASVTERNIEKYDGFVCRYGGEEFVAVLPGRKLEVAQPIIEELFEDLCAQVVQYNEWEIHMSVSVGLTAYPEICEDTDLLLKRADWCMYYAKEHGRHQINVDDGSIQRV